jgi:hypothetical protein
MIKSRRMRWIGMWHTWGRQDKPAYKVLVEKPEGIDHLVYLGIDGRIILKWILNKYDGKCELDLSGS